MKAKPMAASMAGPNWDNMGKERLFVPVFAERDGENSALASFLPDCICTYRPEKVFDDTLDVLLGLLRRSVSHTSRKIQGNCCED